MANLIAVVIARDVALGFEVRRAGVAADTRRLTAYASTAVHGCIGKAMDIAGLGSDALRLIPADIVIGSILRHSKRQSREIGMPALRRFWWWGMRER